MTHSKKPVTTTVVTLQGEQGHFAYCYARHIVSGMQIHGENRDDWVQDLVTRILRLRGSRVRNWKASIASALHLSVKSRLRGESCLGSEKTQPGKQKDVLDVRLRIGRLANSVPNVAAKREPVSTYDDQGNLIDCRMAAVPRAFCSGASQEQLAEAYASETWFQFDDEARELLPIAVASLPKKLQKVAFMLAAGYRQTEIAKACKCTTRTVSNRKNELAKLIETAKPENAPQTALGIELLACVAKRRKTVADGLQPHTPQFTDYVVVGNRDFASCFGIYADTEKPKPPVRATVERARETRLPDNVLAFWQDVLRSEQHETEYFATGPELTEVVDAEGFVAPTSVAARHLDTLR